MGQNNEQKQSSKTYDEAFLELKQFILKTKKEEKNQKQTNTKK